MWELIQSIINMLLLLVIKILKRTIKLFKKCEFQIWWIYIFLLPKIYDFMLYFLEGGRRGTTGWAEKRKWDELAETRVRSSHNKYNNNTNVISYNTEMAIYKNI